MADLDGDASSEVIGSAYSVVVREGGTGQLEWRAKSGRDQYQPDASNVGRTWPGIVIADVAGDRQYEIVTAHGGGHVSVYTVSGDFEPGWPQRRRAARALCL